MARFSIMLTSLLILYLPFNVVTAQNDQQERQPPPTRIFGGWEQVSISRLYEWDISLTARNTGIEPFPVALTLNLESFDSCKIQSVRMGILNPDAPGGIFSGTLEGRNSLYEFQIGRQFLPMTMLILFCQRGPDTRSTDLGAIQVMLDGVEIEEP